MSKLDDFKKFVSHHPEFAEAVRSNNTTWQSLYELYDLYGDRDDVWKKYIKKDIKDSISIEGLLNTVKNINLDSLEENISSIQKAVNLVEELTRKNIDKDTTNTKSTNIDTLYSDNE